MDNLALLHSRAYTCLRILFSVMCFCFGYLYEFLFLSNVLQPLLVMTNWSVSVTKQNERIHKHAGRIESNAKLAQDFLHVDYKECSKCNFY